MAGFLFGFGSFSTFKKLPIGLWWLDVLEFNESVGWRLDVPPIWRGGRLDVPVDYRFRVGTEGQRVA